MESSPKNKNRLGSIRRTFWRGLGLLAVATMLYSGDKTEYEGTIWMGAERLQEAQSAGTRRSVTIENPKQLRIAEYNIKGGSIDREGVIKAARSLGANVLGLTEAGDVSQAIAQNDYNVIYGGAGNVLLTKYPVKEHFSRTLPTIPNKSPRTALFAKLDIGERDQWFVLSHLDHNEWPASAEKSRLKQLDAIQTVVQQELDGDPILIGDLNLIPGGEAYKKIDAEYNDTFTELGIRDIGTFRGVPEMKRLDYILADEDLDFKVVAGGRLESGKASDHDPIMVIGTISGGPKTVAA